MRTAHSNWRMMAVLGTVGLLLGSCAPESGDPASAGQVTLKMSEELLNLKATIPGQTARLDIEGGTQNVTMTTQSDGRVTATVPNVPFGPRQFIITYFGNLPTTSSYPVAEVKATADVGQNANVDLTNSPIETNKFDANLDGISNLSTLLAGLDPGGNAAPVSAIQVSEGGSFTCAVVRVPTVTVQDAGLVRCWGDNTFDQLAKGTTASFSATPVQIPDITSQNPATSIAAAGTFACVLLLDKTVRCWGQTSGGLGDANLTTRSATPLEVNGLTNAKAIAAGFFHACALREDNSVVCWSYNNRGQLGNGSTSAGKTGPVQVVGLPNDIKEVKVGGDTETQDEGTHTCAVRTAGPLFCWGQNTTFQLGNGTTNDSATPQLVTGNFTGAASVAGGGGHTCLINSADRNLRCWGKNTRGQLGAPLSTTVIPQPRAGDNGGGISGATSLAAGVEFTCALIDNGSVRCMGRNNAGQLGNGEKIDREDAVSVTGIFTASKLGNSGGSRNHSCVILQNGGLRCWGANGRGQLGNISLGTAERLTPIQVTGFL